MSKLILMTAVYMAAAVGVMWLQAFLSKRNKKWPGLMIPLLFLLISFLYPLNMAVPETGITGGFVLRIFLSWLLGNIPTFIMLGIYFISRKDEDQ